MAWDSDADDAKEQISDADPTLTDDDNIPNVQMTTMQPEPHLPRACRANTPRFFPDDAEEADITPQVVCPWLKPWTITAQQVQASQVLLLSHDTATELSEDIGIGLLQVGHCKAYEGEEIALVGNIEEVAVVSTCMVAL